MRNVPRRISAQMSATAVFRLLMALSCVLFLAGFLLHMPARLIVEAAPCAIAMLLLQTAKGDGCRFAAGIGLIWVLTIAGVALAFWLPQAVHAVASLAMLAALGPLVAPGPLGALGAAVLVLALLLGFIGLRAPTAHRMPTKTVFFLLGAVVQVLVLQLTLGPSF